MGGQAGHLYGDGFASKDHICIHAWMAFSTRFTYSILLVWLTKDRLSPGPVFGSKDNFNGLGIFFDTYDNERAHVCTMLV